MSTMYTFMKYVGLLYYTRFLILTDKWFGDLNVFNRKRRQPYHQTRDSLPIGYLQYSGAYAIHFRHRTRCCTHCQNVNIHSVS